MRRAFIVLALICLPSLTQASVFHVPSQYPTIQAGIDAAASGDTVLVGPGRYRGNVDFHGKGIRLISTHGAKVTEVIGEVIMTHVEPMGTEMRGFSFVDFTTNPAIRVENGAQPLISDNVFRRIRAYNTVLYCSYASPVIRNNLFSQNIVGTATLLITGQGWTQVIGNTFDGNSRAISSSNPFAVMVNNIVTNSIEYGIHGKFLSSDYNNVWGNSPNYESSSPGVHDLSANPQYLDASEGDLRLTPMSPCLDAGDPDPALNDPDGSRADIGAYAAPLEYPLAFDLSIGGGRLSRVVENLPVMSWRYADMDGGQQSAFEWQVGTDSSWDVTECWSSGEIVSPESTVVYSGEPLEAGRLYYFRVRVRGGAATSDWVETAAKTNQAPGVPSPLAPVYGAETTVAKTYLSVRNAFDGDYDSLSYEFEVYAEPFLTYLISSQVGVPESESETASNKVTGLAPARLYFWRARCFDGALRGAWSPSVYFVTHTPMTFHVPGDLQLIQHAFPYASDGDTILVAPGIYTETIAYGGKSVRIISEAGPNVTILRRPRLADPNWATVTIWGTTEEAEFSGFTLEEDSARAHVDLQWKSTPILRNNIFRNLRAGSSIIFVPNESRPLIERNHFSGCTTGRAAILVESGSSGAVINNTLDHCTAGIESSNTALICRNNIVSNCDTYGIARTDHDYNDLWNNASDYLETSEGANEIHVDPKFISEALGDFRLLPESPCIDTGDPDTAFSDSDGSRSDIGACVYGDELPLTTGFRIGEYENHSVVGQNPHVYWTSITSDAEEPTQFEIEVGEDADWQTAELWRPGPMTYSTPEVEYAGGPLLPGETYLCRLRLSDAAGWGGWTTYSFTMNRPPTTPQPQSPINHVSTPVEFTRLAFSRSSDFEWDDLTYQCQLFIDSSLTIEAGGSVVAGQPGVDQFQTPPLLGLIAGQGYWWRVRASDGKEYSDWSTTQTFLARAAEVRRVPEEYVDISSAIAASQDGDTILVAPGTYSEPPISIGYRWLRLRSSAGPDSTFLEMPVALGNSSNPGAEISGFTFRNLTTPTIITLGAGVVTNNRFIENECTYRLINCTGATNATISRNLFANNTLRSSGACIVGSASIFNNTFDGNTAALIASGNGTFIANNIVTRSTEFGVLIDGDIADYNLVWGNEVDYAYSGPGENDLAEDPQFRSPANRDFRLRSGSPCINAGDPDPQFNDPDGTRNDIGAIPYVEILPLNFQLVEPANQLAKPISGLTPQFEWTISSVLQTGEAVNYKLLVSADSQFAFTQILDSLTVLQATLDYPLAWGTRYWWKVLATSTYGGARWSDEVFTFRTMTLGDADGSGQLNISDVVFLINYIFGQGPAPDPLVSGDMNCDGRINIGDAVHLVNYMFLSGPVPCDNFPTMMPAVDFVLPEALPEAAQ